MKNRIASRRMDAGNTWLWIFFALFAALLGATLFATHRAGAQELDIKTILRCEAHDAAAEAQCDKSRELVVFYCTACHTFIPIVMQQFDAAGWGSLLQRHRGWIANATDADFNQLREYLTANFRPDLPPPPVPEELLENWTSY